MKHRVVRTTDCSAQFSLFRSPPVLVSQPIRKLCRDVDEVLGVSLPCLHAGIFKPFGFFNE